MSLLQRLDQDLKEAMVSKNAQRTSVIRFLKSALKYAAIDKKVETLSDADAQQVIQKQIKQRRESIQQFTQGGRPELAEKEQAEMRILESYLPAQLSDAELQKLVEAEIKAAGAVSKKDFGRMMKSLGEKLQGRADSKRLSEALGKILQ